MIQVLLLAIGGLGIAFALTFIAMPRVMAFMRRRNITGIDVHKLDKPVIPEMGGVGLLVGVAGGCILIFLGSSFLGYGFLDYRVLVFLTVVLLAGLVGAVDDLKTLGAKVKPLLTALACFPIFLSTWIVLALGMPLPACFNPRPRLPLIGRTRLTVAYPLAIPLAIAVPANAVNMLDVFNGVMPLTTILVFAAMLVVSIILLSGGIPGAEIGVLLSCVMLGALLAYFYYNRYPARVFGGDVGALSVGAAIGALAVIGQLEIMAIIALLPAIMNAFYSLVSIGGFLERREMKKRPTIFREDGMLVATRDPDAPLTLTRLVLARGPLPEKRIILSLGVLSLASSILAVITLFLIPLDPPIGYLIPWPLTMLVVLIPIGVIGLVFLALRKVDNLGERLAGLIAIMVMVWFGGMAGFAVLNQVADIPSPPGLELVFAGLKVMAGVALALVWLGLWHIATRLYFRYEIRRSAG